MYWEEKEDKFRRRWRRLGSATRISHVDASADDSEASICGHVSRRWWLFGLWRREVFAQLCGTELSFFRSEDGGAPVLERVAVDGAVEAVDRRALSVGVGARGRRMVLAFAFEGDAELWRLVLRRAAVMREKRETMAREKRGDLGEFFGPRDGRPRAVRGASGSSSSSEVAATLFDPYEAYGVLRTVGSGSYGVVVAARDHRRGGNAEVAIKKVTRALEDLTESRRLAREVRLLKGLDHRNVLPLYDAFYRPGADDVFLVTRMMDSDLHQVIYTRDSPPTRAGKG